MVAINKVKAVWEVKDRYGWARALRINTPNGQPTEFSMVYGLDENGEWNAVRPVSDRYQPVSTATIVDAVRDRFRESDIHTEHVRLGTRCTKQVVQVVLNKHRVKINATPADRKTRFTEFGEDSNTDIWRPTIQVRNAYDGTTAAKVVAGWFRMICSNGMMAEVLPGSSFTCMRIHTVNQIPDLVEEIGKFEFGESEFKEAMDGLLKRKLTAAEVKAIQRKLPKNYKKDLMEAPHENAYQVVSFLLYLQNHEMSIDRGAVVQPEIDRLIKAAA